jgi:hypothetical protein
MMVTNCVSPVEFMVTICMLTSPQTCLAVVSFSRSVPRLEAATEGALNQPMAIHFL